MAKDPKLRRKRTKKTKTPIGIIRPKSRLFTCKTCGAKRKRLHDLKLHYMEEHPSAIKKKPKRNGLTLGQMQARGITKGLTETQLKEAVIIARALQDPHETRRIVSDIIEDHLKRRRARGY